MLINAKTKIIEETKELISTYCIKGVVNVVNNRKFEYVWLLIFIYSLKDYSFFFRYLYKSTHKLFNQYCTAKGMQTRQQFKMRKNGKHHSRPSRDQVNDAKPYSINYLSISSIYLLYLSALLKVIIRFEGINVEEYSL